MTAGTQTMVILDSPVFLSKPIERTDTSEIYEGNPKRDNFTEWFQNCLARISSPGTGSLPRIFSAGDDRGAWEQWVSDVIPTGGHLGIISGDICMRFTDFSNSTSMEIIQSGSEFRLFFSKQAMEMCKENELFKYISPIYDMIRTIHQGVRDITLERTEQSETSDYEKLCFIIQIKGKTSEIVNGRKELRTAIYDAIPREKRQFLRFTYRVI